MQLDDKDAGNWHDGLEFNLLPLLRSELHPEAELVVNFFVRPDVVNGDNDHCVYRLAVLLEALEPVVAKLVAKNINVKLDYFVPSVGHFDVGHMMGPATYKRWKEFLRTEYARRLRQTNSTSVHGVGMRVHEQQVNFQDSSAIQRLGLLGSARLSKALEALKSSRRG